MRSMRSIVSEPLNNLLGRYGYELRRAHKEGPKLENLETYDSFTDSFGNSFPLLGGYRDLIKPGWRTMFDPPENLFPSPDAIQSARVAVDRLGEYLTTHGLATFAARDVLEVGCHTGQHAYTLAARGARSVLAIDIPQYGIRQSVGNRATDEMVSRQSEILMEGRAAAAAFFPEGVTERVQFKDQDVASLSSDGDFDFVVSWETLEHITTPGEAFQAMFDALRPGGLSFHDYNPFFAVNGGHSLCTLDFPYGHARLSQADFLRYLDTYRPSERDQASAFYLDSLNRMTLSEMIALAKGVGFEVLDVLPWQTQGHGVLPPPAAVRQCQRHYPSVTLSDLLSTFVWVLLRKPL